MKAIEYRVTYGQVFTIDGDEHLRVDLPITREVVSVQARDINSGYSKALKKAREPLGNGTAREIASIEFWSIT